MSTLNVDKVDPSTGTALEIGSSGDTVTVPSGATFAVSGTMNASSITAGTIATARLGSGTASSSTVLYGDQTYKAEPGGVNTPLFRARITGQSISNLAYTKIAFDICSGTTGVSDFINGGTYDTTNYKWTPGEAGYYQFTASLYAYTATAFDQFNVRIRLNGATTFLQSLFYHELYGNVTQTGIAHLGATDYVDVEGYQDSGSDLALSTSSNMTFFSGHKLIS
jgi:hypothetical protein